MKIWKRAHLTLVISLLVAVLNSGCATICVIDGNGKNEDYATEFSQAKKPREHVNRYQGGCSGIVTNTAGLWREYYFPQVLNGDRRILRIRVPVACSTGLEGVKDLSMGFAIHHQWKGTFVHIAETNAMPVCAEGVQHRPRQRPGRGRVALAGSHHSL
ncbi:MAG: hypothetical protein WCK89_24335 [bacterium]